MKTKHDFASPLVYYDITGGDSIFKEDNLDETQPKAKTFEKNKEDKAPVIQAQLNRISSCTNIGAFSKQLHPNSARPQKAASRNQSLKAVLAG